MMRSTVCNGSCTSHRSRRAAPSPTGSRSRRGGGSYILAKALNSSKSRNRPGNQREPEPQAAISSQLLGNVAIASFASGAVLGPMLDGLHSSNNVLHYANPTTITLGAYTLETCWWVLVLFGVAGVILGVSVPLLDRVWPGRDQAQAPPAPSWPAVLLCISLFVAQYGLSGALDRALADPGSAGSAWVQPLVALLGAGHTQDVVLIAYAALHYLAFDRTAPGLLMSALTALCGPAIEVALINGPHLYSYTHPQVAGIPLWIAWVYFCGGPAVGNLGRRIWADMEASE
uniref:Uncharacterized protein n=1 Tax=Chlamydomonas leiostraca TaxID=1034604 RepID=A0A7S0RHV2_9CHLO|mmetsp:Transcript_22969/g.58726  ORF Transcript_22969/g.58726 Transcript_22969/m.58726 type:complete len:287 (+) Transcript_22969:3-863(+)